MSDRPEPTALERYQEYYAIRDVVALTVTPLANNVELPDESDFIAEIPEVFRLANDIRNVDLNAVASLRGLGALAEPLMTLLNQQNTKLNLLLGYVLSREDTPDARHQSYEYGGGGVRYLDNNSALQLGQHVKLKIFLREIAAAIYAYADVAAIDSTANGDTLITLAFTRIRDDDREILVRASLQAQTKLLKKRAEERDR